MKATIVSTRYFTYVYRDGALCFKGDRGVDSGLLHSMGFDVEFVQCDSERFWTECLKGGNVPKNLADLNALVAKYNLEEMHRRVARCAADLEEAKRKLSQAADWK